MLRACNRVLKPSGKLVFYVIHFQPGVSSHRRSELIDALPGIIDAPVPYRGLLEQAGFDEIRERDVTAAYQRTATARQEATIALEPGLRAALGDEVYEERYADRSVSVKAIEDGELGRTLFMVDRS